MKAVYIGVALKKEQNNLILIPAMIGPSKEECEKSVKKQFPDLSFIVFDATTKHPNCIRNQIMNWLAENDILGVEATEGMRVLFKGLYGVMKR